MTKIEKSVQNLKKNWNETRIKLPSKYFEFMGDKKDGKGFYVKCLLCHESNTKYTNTRKIELLTMLMFVPKRTNLSDANFDRLVFF